VLTPIAYDRLVALGSRPLVVDDVVDRSKTVPQLDSYIRGQVLWMERLDGAAGAHGAVPACAQMLKYPLDSLVSAARLVVALLDAVDTESVEFAGRAGIDRADPLRRGQLGFHPLGGDVPLWGQLLGVAAAQRGSSVRLVPTLAGAAAPSRASLKAHVAVRLAAKVAAYRHFDAIHWSPRHTGTTLMTWPGGYGSQSIAHLERRRGRRILVLRRGAAVTQLLEPAPWGWRALSPPRSVTPLEPLAARARRSGSADPTLVDELLAEVDGWCGLPGSSEVFRSRVETLVERVAPVVDAAAGALADDLERHEVSSVVSANPSSIEEFTALLAAGRCGIPRTLAQHGDYLFPYEGWLVGETNSFETLLSSDPSLLTDLPEAARRLQCHSPTVVYSDHRRPRSSHIDAGRRPICYVPSFLTGDFATVPATTYDDGWYHRWHLRLLDWMVHQPQRRFIWKALPRADEAIDPIAAVISDEAPNVDYETRPFPRLLAKISRVLVDLPSTPAYEAAWAGLPLIVLSFSRFGPLRPRAVERFGRVVRVCDSEEAALRDLDIWLADDPSQWIVAPEGLRAKPG
jgi:hypothetical protein